VSTENRAAIVLLARGAALKPDAEYDAGNGGQDENYDHYHPLVMVAYPMGTLVKAARQL
jgi:hypothetical protein